MTRQAVQRTILAAMLFTFVVPTFAADAPAADPRYTWNLQDLYPSEAAWVAAREAAVAELPKLEGCRGHLAESAARLAGCLDLVFDLDRRLIHRDRQDADVHVRDDAANDLAGHLGLVPPDGVQACADLTIEVDDLECVGIGESEAADARASQRCGIPSSRASAPRDGDPRGL